MFSVLFLMLSLTGCFKYYGKVCVSFFPTTVIPFLLSHLWCCFLPVSSPSLWFNSHISVLIDHFIVCFRYCNKPRVCSSVLAVILFLSLVTSLTFVFRLHLHQTIWCIVPFLSLSLSFHWLLSMSQQFLCVSFIPTLLPFLPVVALLLLTLSSTVALLLNPPTNVNSTSHNPPFVSVCPTLLAPSV